MRLIDADANRETMLKCAENPESMKAELCYRFTARILEEAPTIDAIPLCFIKDRIEVFKAIPLPSCVDTLELLISQWEQVVNGDADS